MALDVDRSTSVSGLTEAEAREFHGLFLTGFIIFTVIAIIAHFLVWQWRPWLAPLGGYSTSMLQDVGGAARHVLSLLA